MKGLSRILLGSVALLGATAVASADELSSLKTEIEALQSRITRLEAQPQASVPAGYSLLSISDGQTYFEGFEYSRPERRADVIPPELGYTFSVAPTADVAPTSEVFVTAEARTALLYSDFEDGDNLDVAVRARLVVTGKTETPVGEVGGFFRLQATGGGDDTDFDEGPAMQRAYGWWKFLPDWQLLAGQEDTTATLLTSWDWLAATGPVRSFGPSDAYNEQMRLTYTSGAWSFALAAEDPDYDTGDNPRNDIPSIPGYILYSTDEFTAQLGGLWQADTDGPDEWSIGGGVSITPIKGFQVYGAAVVGEGTAVYANNLAPLDAGDSFWLGSAGILADLTDTTRIELGVGIEDYQDAGEALGVGGGLYWTPVTLVSLGVGATYIDFTDAFVGDEPTSDNSLQVFFGVWWRGFRY
ncbi:hypothetical protein G5V57_23620 [Nordella sp. HKS 07]|uniref:hypothetical protein n=1 Tax=Nordella sp. HKS 07 TaxID=2712222 RepID=UPI0013E1C848|nr:hypothetical protein [Nordella sp. HKS 07]QIG50452.1 hypothetical protein G5V57_23620 [Nordella sp. HKS 07]